MTDIYQKTALTGGRFQDSQGNPLSLGYLVFKLSHDSNVAVFGSPTGEQVVAGRNTKMYLNMNGSLNSGYSIWANNILAPSGSFYGVRAFNSSGLEVWSSPQIFQLTYAPTLDIGSVQPVTP
jgi:hypothetical protein